MPYQTVFPWKCQVAHFSLCIRVIPTCLLSMHLLDMSSQVFWLWKFLCAWTTTICGTTNIFVLKKILHFRKFLIACFANNIPWLLLGFGLVRLKNKMQLFGLPKLYSSLSNKRPRWNKRPPWNFLSKFISVHPRISVHPGNFAKS